MDATFAWMIGGGLRTDEHNRDARTLHHLIAIRDAQRDARAETTPYARVAAWFGYQPARATGPVSVCCTPA